MSDYSTRNIIDYAMDEDGVKFREALYASIHDKVNNHISAAKQAVAQNSKVTVLGKLNTESTECKN